MGSSANAKLAMHCTGRTSWSSAIPVKRWSPQIHVSLLDEVFASKCKVPALEDQEELRQWVADGSKALFSFVEAVSASVLRLWRNSAIPRVYQKLAIHRAKAMGAFNACAPSSKK